MRSRRTDDYLFALSKRFFDAVIERNYESMSDILRVWRNSEDEEKLWKCCDSYANIRINQARAWIERAEEDSTSERHRASSHTNAEDPATRTEGSRSPFEND